MKPPINLAVPKQGGIGGAIVPAAARKDSNPSPEPPLEVMAALIIIASATSSVIRAWLIFYGFAPGCWVAGSVKVDIGGRALTGACWIDDGIRTTEK